ncbi:unnamed protein product [Vitrella brassicaformis CCMP3155]|uniref:CCHC-type domain-containing protein n=2 Tax=Vitrella brassicaformis TaxID=1169539 RepID=A0A0G4EWV0_VITBC|nr:unnamed protein product [Vitrella brassicaformis CCMP3155]|eukprot:CEM03243.1 unnamed protein product [Vitrella brassicaformis CCMP3155]
MNSIARETVDSDAARETDMNGHMEHGSARPAKKKKKKKPSDSYVPFAAPEQASSPQRRNKKRRRGSFNAIVDHPQPPLFQYDVKGASVTVSAKKRQPRTDAVGDSDRLSLASGSPPPFVKRKPIARYFQTPQAARRAFPPRDLQAAYDRKQQQYCLLCGGDHESSDCTRWACFYCFDTSHLSAECPYRDVRCGRCGDEGHEAASCPQKHYEDSVFVSEKTLREDFAPSCVTCGERGHLICGDCPHSASGRRGAGGVATCASCGGTRHTIDQCNCRPRNKHHEWMEAVAARQKKKRKKKKKKKKKSGGGGGGEGGGDYGAPAHAHDAAVGFDMGDSRRGTKRRLPDTDSGRLFPFAGRRKVFADSDDEGAEEPPPMHHTKGSRRVVLASAPPPPPRRVFMSSSGGGMSGGVEGRSEGQMSRPRDRWASVKKWSEE